MSKTTLGVIVAIAVILTIIFWDDNPGMLKVRNVKNFYYLNDDSDSTSLDSCQLMIDSKGNKYIERANKWNIGDTIINKNEH